MTESSPSGRGLYDDFRGYRVPTESELDRALQSATVVLDTNVLLNLYRYSDATRDDLLDVLRRIGERLHAPHQVVREFWRNRLSVMSSRGAMSKQAREAFARSQEATTKAIDQWARATALEGRERDVLIERVEALYAGLGAVVDKHAPGPDSTAGAARHEPVLRALETLLDGRVGAAPEPVEWDAAIAEGKARVERREPPGYLDAEKNTGSHPEGAAGDYLVWRQATAEAARRGTDLLLVTGDEKEDWWWRTRTDFIGPRPELVAELFEACGSRLFMMRPPDLLRRANVLRVTVRQDSVDEAERVRRESARPVWTVAGVSALVERLDAEPLDYALVIRAAAAHGGEISREMVYEICGFDDDRMLRGFTRPPSRIMRDLQAEGLVAADVDPPLIPVYVGVKAAAFQVPPEFVALLAGEDAVREDGVRDQ